MVDLRRQRTPDAAPCSPAPTLGLSPLLKHAPIWFACTTHRAASCPIENLFEGSQLRVTKRKNVDSSETQSVRITSLLRDRILDGSFAPRERLQEQALAKQYDTSRTPIRNALSTLAAEGLLVHRPNAGFAVGEFSKKDIDDAYETRAALEGVACRLLAERGVTAQEKAALEHCLGECAEVLKQASGGEADLGRYYSASNEFHDVIIDASRNRYLIRSVRLTLNVPFLGGSSQSPRFKEQVLLELRRFANLERLKIAHTDQRRILEALLARQGSRAEALMRELVLWGKVSYLEKADRYVGSIASGQKPS